jgi:RNA polymerase sigma factor (TIGR02999 family)
MMSGERAGHTLQPTALVNEAWMRMIRQQDVDWQDRDHFLRLAARTMRRVLVDHARARGRAKRGGDRVRCDLEGDLVSVRGDSQLLVEFDEALAQLEAMDEQLARIVELRFFGGHTIEEAARLLGVSHGTVERGWSVARLWLARSLDEHGCD